MEAVFVYKYEPDQKELFAVAEIMEGYSYDLASIEDIGFAEKWGDIIFVCEGVYFYNELTFTYMKIEHLVVEARNAVKGEECE